VPPQLEGRIARTWTRKAQTGSDHLPIGLVLAPPI